MPIGLLDLPDEVLYQIGIWSHGDTYIIFPSLYPQWANFTSELDPKVQQDFMAYRSTCKRVRQATPVKNLHVELTEWEELIDWNDNVPNEIKQAVGRLILEIQPEKNPKDGSMAEVHQHTWLTVIKFLSSLDSLQELIIKDLPCCQHHETDYNHTVDFHSEIIQHRVPEFQFSHNIQSVGLESPCMKCMKVLPLWFTQGAKCLKSLKLVHYGIDPLFDYNTIKEINLNNTELAKNLQNFYIKIDDEVDGNDILQQLAITFPNLQTLNLTAYELKNDISYITGPFTIFASTPSIVRPEWKFSFRSQGYHDHFHDDDGISQEWTQFLKVLSQFKYLKHLDFVIDFQISDNCYPERYNKRNLKYSEFQETSSPKLVDRLYANGKNKLMFSAMKSAIKIILSHIPTLETGKLWNHHLEGRYSDQFEPYICEFNWKCKTREDGQYDIIIENHHQTFSDDFIKNHDGTNVWYPYPS